jgi:hypothetical protein
MSTYRRHYVQIQKGFARVSDEVPCHVGRSTGCVSSSISRNVGHFSNNRAIKVKPNPFLVVISGRFIPYGRLLPFTGRSFMKFDAAVFFENYFIKIKVPLKPEKNNRYFT